MTPYDLDEVMRLENATPEAPHWSRAAYERFLSNGADGKRIFIAEEGGRLLGFAAVQIILDVCELESIAVDIRARLGGIGRMLLDSVFDWATLSCAVRVQLEVRSGNSCAIAFYIRSGFTKDGLRSAYYRDPEEDAVLMSRELGQSSASVATRWKTSP